MNSNELAYLVTLLDPSERPTSPSHVIYPNSAKAGLIAAGLITDSVVPKATPKGVQAYCEAHGGAESVGAANSYRRAVKFMAALANRPVTDLQRGNHA